MSGKGNELCVEVVSVSKLSFPQAGIGARLGQILGSSNTSNVYVSLELSGHRVLQTFAQAVNICQGSATLQRQKFSYKVRGVEDQMVVSVRERNSDPKQGVRDALLGQGKVTYSPEFEDGEAHNIVVPVTRDGKSAGEVSLLLTLVKEVTPVTSGPAVSQAIVENLYKVPQDVLDKLLHIFGVPGEDSQEDQVDALLQAFDVIERNHGAKLTSIYEAETDAADETPTRPSFGARAMTRIGNLFSSDQAMPRHMIPWSSRVSHDTREILLEWIKCRQQIAQEASVIAEYLDHEGKVLAGIGIISHVCQIVRGGFEVAALVTASIPQTDGISATMVTTAVSLGLGNGITAVVTSFVASNSEKHKARGLFQQVAQESELHRKAYFALHGGRDEPDEDLPLDELPLDTNVDANLKFAPSEILEIVRAGFETAAGATGVAQGIDAIVEAGHKMAGEDPSEGGNKMKELAEAYGYEGKDPEVVADMMIADPKKYVLPPPGGVAMFDVLNTTLTVRMVVREAGKTHYFAESTPVTLAGRHCEISFQVLLKKTWEDINEWDSGAKTLKVPAKKQVYRVNGKKDFRWFHLEGRYPIKVVSVDNENGPM